MSTIAEEKTQRDIALPASFYDRDTVLVARQLLGKLIVIRRDEKRAVRIVETEAYVTGDPANHAFRGQTKRNQSMFKGPGTIYVYAVHGQNCMNAVTRRGEAVLIRAAEPVENVSARTSGPGLLCRAVGITRQDDGKSLVDSEISVMDDDYRPARIVSSPRIGVTEWKDCQLRFHITDNPSVSKKKR